jgi:hypothetical protein
MPRECDPALHNRAGFIAVARGVKDGVLEQVGILSHHEVTSGTLLRRRSSDTLADSTLLRKG